MIVPRKPQQATQKPKGEKTMIDAEKEQNAPQGISQEKYDAVVTELETMKLQFNSAAKDYSDLKTESLEYRKRNEELENENHALNKLIDAKNGAIMELKDKVSELEESLVQSDHVSEITSLHFELDRLKKYEADYRNLEVDYRNLHSENERLKRMLDRLKNTERMNLWMMEQYVGLHKQVDEVLA